MAFLKSVATISSLTIISRVFGFIRDALIAAFVGAGPIADAFFVAFKVPNFFRRLFAEGALNAAFVPLFSRTHVSEGASSARLVAEQVFSVLMCTLLLFVIVVEVFLPYIMFMIAPGFQATPERLLLATEFTHVTFPYILFISLAAFLSGILNSLHRFAASSAAPILLNLTMILGLLFCRNWGDTVGHVLVWTVFISGVLQFIWMWLCLRRQGFIIRLRLPVLTPVVKQMLRVMTPGALGAGVVQVNLFIDVVIASFLPIGAVSYLFYADRLVQLPLSVIGLAISTPLLPRLAKHIEQQEHEKAQWSINRALELTSIFALPSAIALCVMAHPFISILFERGAFASPQVWQTAKTLSAFSLGLPAFIMIKILSTPLFATFDTKTPVKASLIAMGVNIILNLILMGPFAHVGIAFATTLASWVNAGILYAAVYRRNLFRPDARLKQKLLKIMLAAFTMGVVLFGLTQGVSTSLISGAWSQVGVIFFICFAGFLSFVLSCYVLRAVDIQEIRDVLLKKRT